MKDQPPPPTKSLPDLAEELLDSIRVSEPQVQHPGEWVSRRDLEQILPNQRPTLTVHPFMWLSQHSSQGLFEEVEGWYLEPSPKSLQDLRRLLTEAAPNRFQQILQAHIYDDKDHREQPDYPTQPFPPELVGSVVQDDLDKLHSVLDSKANPLRFSSTDPVFYAWAALHYFAVNYAAGQRGNFHSSVFPDPYEYDFYWDKVEPINERMKEYAERGIRVPAMFLICSYAALMQSSLPAQRDRKKLAQKDLRELRTWANRLTRTIREQLDPPDPKFSMEGSEVGYIRAGNALRLISAPGCLPRIAIAREFDALRKPLEHLLERIQSIVDEASAIEKEQTKAAESFGIRKGNNYSVALRRAFLTLRDLLAVNGDGTEKPRKEVGELLALWGIQIPETTSNIWIKRAMTD